MLEILRPERKPGPRVEDIKILSKAYDELTKVEDVRHVAIINRLGRPVARSYIVINRLLDEQKLAMVYMQLFLDYSMRKELDPILGQIDYITSKRKNQQ